MNRAERRRAGIAEKPATVTMTRDAVDAMVQEAFDKGYNHFLEISTPAYLATFLLALRDSFDFGRDRLSSVVDKCMFLLTQVADHELEFKEIIATLKEEVGIDISGDGEDIYVRGLTLDRMEKTTRYGISKREACDEHGKLAWMEMTDCE